MTKLLLQLQAAADRRQGLLGSARRHHLLFPLPARHPSATTGRLTACFLACLLALAASTTLALALTLHRPDAAASPRGSGYAVVINTWKRHDLLKRSVGHYSGCAGVDAVHVVWSEPREPPEALRASVLSCSRRRESIPLLSQLTARDGAAEGEESSSRWWSGLAREVSKVGYVALPMAAVSVAQYAVQVASNMMVGHLPGVLPLSASAIATSLASVSGFSLLIGMASGLETLCGQAYGAKQYDKLGVQTYRAIVTLTIVSIPVSLLWVFIGKLLTLIGQDPLISQEAGRYIVWLIPGLFAYAVSQPLTKFLQSQSLIVPMLWSSIATLLLHIPICWLLVFKTSLGYIGAALAISISYWLTVFMLAAYIRFSSSCKETTSPPTIEAFRGVGLFLRLALPSALMLCFEWWSFEILILLSGVLPNPELQTSVLSICLTTISLMYTIPYGLGAAASTRVANELGAGNPEGARSAVRVVMSIAVTEAVFITGALLASQHILGYAYSSDKEVVAYVTAMVPFVCVSVAADSLQGVLSGYIF